MRKEKPPVPKYHYKLITVSCSQEAGRMENALRGRLSGAGLSFFAICHEGGCCDVMGDSGANPLLDVALDNARGVAAEIMKGLRTRRR
jgi:hypothetical protein